MEKEKERRGRKKYSRKGREVCREICAVMNISVAPEKYTKIGICKLYLQICIQGDINCPLGKIRTYCRIFRDARGGSALTLAV